jgi:hypothetical protein
MWAIAERFAESEWLFDMFYIERQHKRVKPNAETLRNTVDFEASVLMRVLDSQVCSLQAHGDLYPAKYKLVNRQVRGAVNGVSCSMADRYTCGGANLSCDDIVLDSNGHAAVILGRILFDDMRCMLKAELMRSVGRNVWAQSQQQAMWIARDTFHPVAWRQREDGTFVLIN